MSTFETLIASYQFNRTRTLGLLAEIEKMPDPEAILGWRPGPGRGHASSRQRHNSSCQEDRQAAYRPA